MMIKNILLSAVIGCLGLIGAAQANDGQLVPAAHSNAQSESEAKTLEASVPVHQPDYNKIIKDQLEAIRARDDRTAYELNSSTLKEDFEDPQSYMRMLRREKSPLYNHVGYKILTPPNADAKFHKVRLIDKYGKFSIAMFRIEEDSDGQWRTSDIVILSGGDDPI